MLWPPNAVFPTLSTSLWNSVNFDEKCDESSWNVTQDYNAARRLANFQSWKMSKKTAVHDGNSVKEGLGSETGQRYDLH